MPIPPPGDKPNNLRISNIDYQNNIIRLDWNAVDNAEKYRVYFSTKPGINIDVEDTYAKGLVLTPAISLYATLAKRLRGLAG